MTIPTPNRSVATQSPWDLAHDEAERVSKGVLIGGHWRSCDRRFAVLDPATLETIAEVADVAATDLDDALDASTRVSREWRRTAPRQRAEILRSVARMLRERTNALAALITLERGKPFAESRGEVAYAAGFFDWYAEEAVRLPGMLTRAPDGGKEIAVSRTPVGTCVLVTPWNFPLALPARKLAPAIAAGCTVILKPSELTPLSANALGEILVEAGVPDGVVSIVHTTRPGPPIERLLSDVRVRKLSFTGSTPVGRALLAVSAANVLRVSMELGGNAPFVVCHDADIDIAIAGAVEAKMRNNGEACTAANRFYVHRAVVDEFTERLAERFAEIPLGHGLDEGVGLGPLINEAGLEKANRVIAAAVDAGATAIRGQETPGGLAGAFCRATVLANVPADCAALEEEVFAPVASIVTVDDDEQAIRLANDNPFGLVAYLFTSDVSRARDVTNELEAGMVGLNTGLVSDPAAPFGGIKQSGLGREGSAAGLEEYLDLKYVAVPTAPPRGGST